LIANPVLYLQQIVTATASIAPVMIVAIFKKGNITDMKKTIYKILGKRGRITIPWEIRKTMGFAYNDVISFMVADNAVLLKCELLCDGCSMAFSTEPQEEANAFKALLDELTTEEIREAIVQLSVRWAEIQKSGDGV